MAYTHNRDTPGRSGNEGKAVIFGSVENFPPDAVERELPDAQRARQLLETHRPEILQLLARRRMVYHDAYGEPAQVYLERAENAVILGLARLAVRHGRLGSDFHPYHNEDHALEILDRRLGRVLGQHGVQSLPGKDWLALAVFAACHDLHQREPPQAEPGIGRNELASIAETLRILHGVGFDFVADREIFITQEIMIAGSTFDAGPRAATANPAEAVASGGPLAPRLPEHLDRVLPNWRSDETYARAIELALLASDLDTANVSERFLELATSATRLAEEREVRAGRTLQSPESGEPVLRFLTQDQERYFFQLHRFCSSLGNTVFSGGKQHNAPRLHKLIDALRTHFDALPKDGFTGADVIAMQLKLGGVF